MAAEFVDASPTREFFAFMLTRDISLQDCILDLIDNCLDGARRSIKDYSIDDPSDDAYAGYECGLTDFLYQRDGETIAFALPDLAVSGMGSSSVAPAAYS